MLPLTDHLTALTEEIKKGKRNYILFLAGESAAGNNQIKEDTDFMSGFLSIEHLNVDQSY